MRRFDPAANATDKHYRAAEIAEILSIGYSTALRLIKAHPKVKYLPALDRRQGRSRRTPMLAKADFEAMYTEEMVP